VGKRSSFINCILVFIFYLHAEIHAVYFFMIALKKTNISEQL